MILTVFRPKRIKNGKARVARSYRGRYRLEEEDNINDIPLYTTDKRVARERLEKIVVLLTPANLSPLAAGRLAQLRAISRSASSLSSEYSETEIVRHEQGWNPEGRDPIGSAHIKARLEKVG